MKRFALSLITGLFLLAAAMPALAARGSFRIAPGPVTRGPGQLTTERSPDIDRFGPGLMDRDRPVFHFSGPGPQILVGKVMGVSGNIVRMNLGASGIRQFILPPSPRFRHWSYGQMVHIILP